MTERKKTESFLAAISYAGDVEAKRIKEEAERRADERVAAARDEVRAEEQSRAEREIAKAEARFAARVAEAESAAAAAVAKEREAATERVLGRAANKLAWFTGTDGYEKYMTDSAKRIAELTKDEEDRVIFIRKEDEKLRGAISKAAGGIPVEVSDAVAVGGLICDCRGMTCDLSFGTALDGMREVASRELKRGEEAAK